MIRFTGLVCLLLFAGAMEAQSPIRLRTRDLPAAAQPGKARITRGGHYILGFSEYPNVQIRAGLARRGIRVLQYVPDGALLVSVPSPASLDGLDLTFATAMEAGDKLTPGLADQPTNAYLVIFHADIEATRARELARSAGFDIVDHPSVLANQLVAVGSFTGLRGLADNDEVQYVLPASPDLVAGAPLVACLGAMAEAGPIGEYVLAGKAWTKDSSGTVALGYFVQNVTEKADANAVHGEIERALREWSKYVKLTWTRAERADAARTITVRFAKGAHGDEYPFDGVAKVLGHTFYPGPNSEPTAGDLHLDADEDWHIGGGTDIFSVVLHEAGHALGMSHSAQPGSVMFPYYRVATSLSADDIAGIQALYGDPAPPAPPPATTPPTSVPGAPSLQPGAPSQPATTPTSEPGQPPLLPPAAPAQPPSTPAPSPVTPSLQPPTTPSAPAPPPATPPQTPTTPTTPTLQPPTAPSQPTTPAPSPTPPVQPPTTPVQPSAPPVQPPTTPVQPSAPPIQPPTTPVQPSAPPVQPPSTPTQPPAAPVQPSAPPMQPPTTPAPPPTTPPQPPTEPPVTSPPTTPDPPQGEPESPPSEPTDTTAPTLRIVSPSTTIVSTSAATISMNGTASDSVGVASIKWTTSLGTTESATGTNTWSAAIPLLVGTNVITIRAYDAAGNSSWRAVTVVRR